MTIFSHECEPSPVETVERFFFFFWVGGVARLNLYCLTVIGRGEFKRILSFLFVETEKLNFSKENWLQWLRPSFLHDRAVVLLWNTTKDSKVCKEISGSLFTIMAKEITLSKENLCTTIYKCLIDILFSLTLTLKKN